MGSPPPFSPPTGQSKKWPIIYFSYVAPSVACALERPEAVIEGLVQALLLLQALPQLSAQGKHTVHMVVGDDIHRVGVHGNSPVPHHRAAVG